MAILLLLITISTKTRVIVFHNASTDTPDVENRGGVNAQLISDGQRDIYKSE